MERDRHQGIRHQGIKGSRDQVQDPLRRPHFVETIVFCLTKMSGEVQA